VTDPRLIPANDHVMADHLPQDGSGRRRVTGIPMVIGMPIVDLARRPDGPRDRQLLLGEDVTVLQAIGDTAFVQARKDAYVGYLPVGSLSEASRPATHSVTAPATHTYPHPDIKCRESLTLSFGARLTVTGEDSAFFATPQGFVPKPHLTPLEQPLPDPVAVAELFLGTPYLWGGNSRAGIDCSGLIQTACLACAIPCPGDSDQQEQALGKALPGDTRPERGDLLFWKGHVAWVLNDTEILHANAHTMSVARESRLCAIDRIRHAGEGPITSHKRL